MSLLNHNKTRPFPESKPNKPPSQEICGLAASGKFPQAPVVFLATYVHHLDPILIHLGKFPLRWYGLAYLGGFFAAFLLLRHLTRKNLWILEETKIGDFIAMCALFGVFLGGRIGYALFYKRELLTDFSNQFPFWGLLEVWGGGMASHGGILGLFLFTLFYARKNKVSWLALGDGLCTVAPIGLFLGRIANFINGELYGRIAHGVSWAIKFPLALEDPKAPEFEKIHQAFNAAATVTGNTPAPQTMADMLTAIRTNPNVRNAIAPYLEPRYPSQLLEGASEGILLFTILWLVRIKWKKAPTGFLTGLFFLLYPIFRIICEQFRQPDVAWVIDGTLTQGQFLSLFMFAFAAFFLSYSLRQYRQNSSRA